MEDIWPQEEPLNKIERESNQCNYQSDHLDGIEENRQFIRDCSSRVHKLYNGKLNSKSSVVMEIVEDSSTGIGADISDSISTRMDNQTFAHDTVQANKSRGNNQPTSKLIAWHIQYGNL